MNESELQYYLYKNIPISKALGILVVRYTEKQVILSAPLDLNINHKETVFGGSLHSVATLSCWSLIYINLKLLEIPAEIVISKSEVKYLAPVKSDFESASIMDNQNNFLYFKNTLCKKNKARIKLHATIYQNETLAFDYLGCFVAIKKQ